MEILISIIVPVYNSKKTIKRCIDSILQQDMSQYELIIVDDGSTDGSGEICDLYCHDDAKVRVFHTENNGVSAARNYGIDRAKGKYVLLVDSDDYVESDICSVLLSEIERNDAELVIAGYTIIGQESHMIEKDVCYNRWKDYPEGVMTLYTANLINTPFCKLFIRSKMGRFIEELSLGEDLLFTLQYLENIDKVCCINRSVYFLDPVEGSLSRRYREDYMENCITLFVTLVSFFDRSFLNGYDRETLDSTLSTMFRQYTGIIVKEYGIKSPKSDMKLKEWLQHPLIIKSLYSKPLNIKSKVFNSIAKTNNIFFIKFFVYIFHKIRKAHL